MVDGILIRDVDRLLQIQAEDVEKIEVVNLNYFFKGYELGRILAFYTKNSDLSTLEFDDRIFRQSHEFYSSEHKFIAPDYSNENVAKNIPDYRNVLYWYDDLKDSNISFYTSDSKGKYTIVVEGYNKNGVKECYEESFEVE